MLSKRVARASVLPCHFMHAHADWYHLPQSIYLYDHVIAQASGSRNGLASQLATVLVRVEGG